MLFRSLSRDAERLRGLQGLLPVPERVAKQPLWTDDYNNLLHLLK